MSIPRATFRHVEREPAWLSRCWTQCFLPSLRSSNGPIQKVTRLSFFTRSQTASIMDKFTPGGGGCGAMN